MEYIGIIYAQCFGKEPYPRLGEDITPSEVYKNTLC